MKILFASDSFKGSLSSKRIAELLDIAALKVFPDAVTDSMAVADGGEGTMEVVVDELGGTLKEVSVKGPLFEDVTACYGILPDNCAIIEMASASGLPMVPDEKRNPLYTTTYGTGQLIKDALDGGIRKITIAIGGSATNDGGMGMLSALGIRFLDESGNELQGIGENLEKVKEIDMSSMDPAIRETKFEVMCDITNPLTGKEGCAYVFAPQKGADSETVKRLDEGMINFADVVDKATNTDCRNMSGAGAAGGLGYALCAFLGAKLKPGIEAVLDMLDFDSHLKDAAIVITGEGRMDSQSSHGKVASGIGKRCKKAGIPAAAIVGGLMNGYEDIYNCGISTVMTTINSAMTIDEAMKRSEELYLDAAYRLFNAVKCGIGIGISSYDI